MLDRAPRQSWPRGQWVVPGQWAVPGSCQQVLKEQEWIWNKTRMQRKLLKNQFCFYSSYILYLLFISWKGSLRWNNLSFTKYLLIDNNIFLEWESRYSSKMKAQCLLQKFTSCSIARGLKMLHIKMFISNVVQEIFQTTKMANLQTRCK